MTIKKAKKRIRTRNGTTLEVKVSNMDMARLIMSKNSMGYTQSLSAFATDVLCYFHYSSLKNKKTAWEKWVKNGRNDALPVDESLLEEEEQGE